jgi:hypothetical protein
MRKDITRRLYMDLNDKKVTTSIQRSKGSRDSYMEFLRLTHLFIFIDLDKHLASFQMKAFG